MTEQEAKQEAERLRSIGYDVTAALSPIGDRGWELRLEAADGGRPLYAFSRLDVKILVVGGAVKRLP